jgi:hypothetical protein
MQQPTQYMCFFRKTGMVSGQREKTSATVNSGTTCIDSVATSFQKLFTKDTCKTVLCLCASAMSPT